MNCGGWQRIACALETIAENGSGGRDAYDVWAQILIPAAIGLGSLLIGIAALLLTHRSYIAEKENRDRTVAGERLARRQSIGLLARRYMTTAYGENLGVSSPLSVDENSGILRLQMSEEIDFAEEPYGEELYAELRSVVSQLPSGTGSAAVVYGTTLTGVALLSVREWVRDPEFWNGRRDLRKDTAEERLESARAAYLSESVRASAGNAGTSH